jgi:hypothetical protein
MYKLIIIILVLFVININCTGDREPVIKLGKEFDKIKIEVSDETYNFHRNDNFAYTLSQKNPFTAEIITRRLYQGKEYIDMIRKESVDIDIIPGTKKIGESIPVEKLIQKYGSGNYLILFTINESVIAKKSFIVEGNTLKPSNVTEKQVKQDIMPMRTEKHMPKPNMYETDEAIADDKITPLKGEKYIPNQNTRDDMMPKRQERNIPVSPSDMLKDNK